VANMSSAPNAVSQALSRTHREELMVKAGGWGLCKMDGAINACQYSLSSMSVGRGWRPGCGLERKWKEN